MSTNFDYIVIGSGLSGLSIASRLSQENAKVALIESLDVPGGSNKKISFPNGTINNALRMMPATDSSLNALSFLENLLGGLKIIKATEERPPVTFEGGQIKPFLGFGENPPAFYEELPYFTSASVIEWHLEPFEWTRLLFEKFQGTFMPHSIVTQLKIENNKVESILINGSKVLKAENFIFCAPLRELNTLVPEKLMNFRLRQRLAKNNFWTLVGIDFCHNSQITDLQNIHVLNGVTQDEVGPCLGRFSPSSDESQQFSQWITFVDEAEAEDTEVIAIALKKMKRQIKRAYPTAFENLKAERISITPLYSGISEIKLQGNQTLPGIENLWIGSGQAHVQKNLIGTLLQSELVISALGFASSTTQPVIEERGLL
ncbi:MAG: NAD(P)-binding protein [Bdellovibrionota bacterium]